jgi:tRNA nucleotidyltransferase (CCA-adding enzyme)
MFEVLRECGALARLLPEVDRLWGVPQPPQHHPEVDTGVHLMMVLDMSARWRAAAVRFACLGARPRHGHRRRPRMMPARTSRPRAAQRSRLLRELSARSASVRLRSVPALARVVGASTDNVASASERASAPRPWFVLLARALRTRLAPFCPARIAEEMPARLASAMARGRAGPGSGLTRNGRARCGTRSAASWNWSPPPAIRPRDAVGAGPAGAVGKDPALGAAIHTARVRGRSP